MSPAFTRNGHDWSGRFLWIIESALKNRQQHFVIDGEAGVLGVDGIADLNALHSRRHDDEVLPSTSWRLMAKICAADAASAGTPTNDASNTCQRVAV
jgi:ATP-dependent DNA ligase